MGETQDLRGSEAGTTGQSLAAPVLRVTSAGRRVAGDVGVRHMGRLVRGAPSFIGTACVVVLLAFHAWLFLGRAAAGQLVEPAHALRWSAAGLLLLALLVLRRLRVPLLWGRKAAVFWLLVALAHSNVIQPTTPREADGGSLDWVLALPAVAAPLLLVLVLGAGGGRFRRRSPAARPSFASFAADRLGPGAAVFLLQHSPRPPPA